MKNYVTLSEDTGVAWWGTNDTFRKKEYDEGGSQIVISDQRQAAVRKQGNHNSRVRDMQGCEVKTEQENLRRRDFLMWDTFAFIPEDWVNQCTFAEEYEWVAALRREEWRELMD